MEEAVIAENKWDIVKRLSGLFSAHKIALLHDKNPKVYLSLCLLMAVFAYTFIIGMPLLALSLPFSLYQVGQEAIEHSNWLVFSLLMILQLMSTAVSIALLRVRFKPPQGPVLREQSYPQLFQVIDELKTYYKSPLLRIDQVILCDSFEINITRTPRFPLPFMFTNTLMVGLPVLQSMKSEAFRALLARELSRASMRQNYLSGWLAAQVSVWKQYLRCARKGSWLTLPVYVFFKYFMRFYQMLMNFLLRQDTLLAEHDVLELFNDEDLLEYITAESVVREFINSNYWPKVRKIALQHGVSDIAPHARMADVARRFTRSTLYKKSINQAMARNSDPLGNYTTLTERIQNLGHMNHRLSAPLDITAAEHYLGQKLASVIDVLDKKWRLGFSQVLNKNTTSTMS